MPYQTIIALPGSTETSDAILDAAIMLTGDQDGYLIGLYVIPQYKINLFTGYDASPKVLENFRNAHLESANAIAEKLELKRKSQNISAKWRVVEAPTSDIAPVLVEHSRMADVVIAGQQDSANTERLEETLCEHLLMQSGRPVLQVPAGAALRRLGRDVLVAWDGGRQATRAVFDALPVLRRAENVHLHWVDPPKSADDHAESALFEMAAALARHGVKVSSSESASGGLTVGEALLDQVSKKSCDLLVLGAYGHWRMREYVIGGTTRYVLRHCTVPVLMSH